MKYLFDTNIIIDVLRNNIELDSKFLEAGAGINTITLAELYCGVEKSQNKEKSRTKLNDLIEDFDLEIVDFGSSASIVFGKLKSLLEVKGNRLDDMDLLIASTAIAEGKTLVSNNLKHFERIKNLIVVASSL